MAFDQNLEADRIDGYNLFSAFVRVPLLVLGGILGSDDSSKSTSNDIDVDLISKQGRCVEDSPETGDHSTGEDNSDDHRASETDSTNRLTQQRQPSNTSLLAYSGIDLPESETGSFSGIKRTKNLSWSDESGLPLVYENNESSPQYDHKVSPYTSVTGSFQKPTKSALRKSKSSRYESHELSSHEDKNTAGTPSRYIPNMNPRTAGNGLILPTRPYGMNRYTSGGSNGSEMSPQWGWYINTTPPTPELYHSRSTVKSSPPSATTRVDTRKTIQASNLSGARDAKACQNQVFQNLQNSTKTNRMGGWTSIPI